MPYQFKPELILQPEPLETERLVLKPLVAEHRPLIYKGLSDREVRHNIQMQVLDTPEKQDAWWDKFMEWRAAGQAMQWAVFLKDTDEYVSLQTVKEIDQKSFRGESGYSVLKEFWGMGIGTEGARAVMDYCFNKVNFHTLFAQISPQNERSINLIRKLGFEQEAHLRDVWYYEGKFYDLLQFYIINPHHK